MATEQYATIVRKGHPLVKRDLDVATFQKLAHILTSPHGDLVGVVDEVLKKRRLKRRVVAGVTTFQVIGKLVAQSDCCATLPRSVALEQAKYLPLEVFSPPVELKPIKLLLIWHQRVHTSPLHQWLRGEIQRVFNPGGNE